MNGMFCQDMIMKWYTIPIIIIFILMFCPYYAIYGIPALLVTMWAPVLITMSMVEAGERMTHFGSYAVCSQITSRKQFMNSKYASLFTILVASALLMAAISLIFRNDSDMLVLLADILMTSLMCLFGFSLDLTLMFRDGFDDTYLPAAIVLSLAAVNVLILAFWPGEIALVLVVVVASAIGTAVCWKRSCEYAEKMNF